MGALVTRGGPRPNAGRKPHRDPETADDAVAELWRYLPDDAVCVADDVIGARRVVLDVRAANALLWKLRRRKGRPSAPP